MTAIIKCLVVITSTILMLSITINNRPIFSFIYETISPATKSGQALVMNLFDKSLERTQDYSKKLFDNSIPKVGDAVRSQLSSQTKNVAEPAEKILDEEKAELDQLIKTHRK